MPSLFGILLGSFSGLPLLTRRCAESVRNNPAGTSSIIVYRTPSWFWDRFMTTMMKTIPICGRGVNVKFPRVVPPSLLYLFAMHGDTIAVNSLLTEGSASPWDVNDRGSSKLYVSHTKFALPSFSIFL